MHLWNFESYMSTVFRNKNKCTSVQQHLYLFWLFQSEVLHFFTSVFLIAKVNAKLDLKFEMRHHSA